MTTSDDVLRYLLDGVSVDVVGRPGSGRTEVVRRVAAGLEREMRPVVHLHGVRAQRDRPLGFAVIGNKALRQASFATVRDFSDRLLRELRPGAVILADDADDLDGATAGVLGMAHVLTRVPVLVSRRPPLEPTGAVQGLVSDLQPGVRITMSALPYDELYCLVHNCLGSRVDSLTIARIATISGGLPGLAKALVIIGRRKGVLREVDGVWRAVGPLWMPELSHAVGSMLASVAPDDVTRLGALAEHGVLDLNRALGIVSGDRLAFLQRCGFVEIRETSAGSLVDVFPPLLGEYLRGTHTTYLRFSGAGTSTPSVLHQVAPGAHGPAAGADSVLSRLLAEHAKAAVEGLRDAWKRDPTASAAVPLLRSLFASELLADELDTVYELTDATRGTPEDRARFYAWVAIGRSSAALDPTAGSSVLDTGRWALPGESAYFSAVHAHLRFVFDRVPEIAAAPANPSGLGREMIEALRLEEAVAAGAVVEAQELMRSYEPLRETFRENLDTCHSLALVLDGRLREGAEVSLARLAAARRDRDASTVIAQSYVAALCLAVCGRLAEMNEVLSAAMTVTSVPILQTFMHSGLRGLAAWGASWQGREQCATLLDAEARTPDCAAGPYPAMHAGEVLRATNDGVGAELWAVARDRLDRGYVAAGIFAAVEATELTRAGMVEYGVRAAAQGADGHLLEVLLAYAEAICDRDLQALATVADEFMGMGASLYAARAKVSRAEVLREEGASAAAIAEMDAAWEIASGFGTPVGGLFAGYSTRLDISAREAEVIDLLVAGLGTVEIAEAITVSTRTVENHIFSVYRKVGLDSRAELRRVAHTWLALT